MHIKYILRTLLILFLVGCTTETSEPISPQIIPIPLEIKSTQGVFILDDETEIVYADDFKVSGEFLKAFLEEGTHWKFKKETEKHKIVFEKDTSLENVEAYRLKVTKDKITISAASDQGAFYAVQSLRQLLPSSLENGSFEEKEIAIQCLTINDVPQFQYRGMHLDVGRHFFSVDFIKKYIDAIAMLKMNTFHWHLTEDQGWRIEIKKYPRLQEIAAYRNETLIGHYSDEPHQFDGKKYGGYYTQEEIKDVVAYASQRFVTIIPEIELPGHSQAAIAAYPELGCNSGTNKKVEVATKWGVFDEIYCPTEKTFQFLEDVLDEVMTLFPSKYIHIGGDEAPKTKWKTSEVCQKIIKKEGLKDEHELQNYFITRIEKYVNSKGRQIIGWDEILEGGLAPNASVMSWRGTKGAVEAAKQKHNVILTPTSHCYFDYYQSDNENEPLAIGGFLPLEKVYSFNPIPEELTEAEAKYVLGAQGNVWTEYMPTEDKVEYMAFPRMLAMSEVTWSSNQDKNYNDFVSRLEHFHKRLEALDIKYANHLYEIEGELYADDKMISYTLKTLLKDKTIRYTTDGTNPSLTSKEYESIIPITTSIILRAAVFNEETRLGSVFTEEINFHKAVGKSIIINEKPHKAYQGSGAAGLLNGISGNDTRFGDKEWLGFWGKDLKIMIDLGKETEISGIETRFYNGNGQWIYAPKNCYVAFDDDEFQKLEMINPESKLVNAKLNSKTKARYIKLKIENYGVIPDGKQGSGNKAWTFIDEIIVK